MAKLAIYRGSTLDRHLDLAERDYRIGRGEQNDIVLEDSNKGVSRLHAELRFEGGRFVVTDLNSQNGVWLEGKKVPRVALEPGAPVTIGPYQLVLEPQGAPKAAPAGPPPVPVEAPKVKAEPPKPAPKPAARKSTGPSGLRGRNLVLVAALFLLLIVAGVAIGLYWPSGEDSPTATDQSQQAQSTTPQASDTPAAGGQASTPGTVPVGGQADAPVQPATEPATPPAAETALPAATRATGGGQAAARTPTGGQASTAGRADPSVPTRRPGESVNAWRARVKQVQTWYKQGTSALREGDFSVAIARFEAILREDPAYLDVPTLLEDARQNMRGAAQKALEGGLGLEQSGDYPGALQFFERAVALDPTIQGVDEATKRVRGRMLTAGEDSFKRARQYDALGRAAEAIVQYERVLQLLPADHESRKVARERLDALKGGIK